MVPGKSLPGCQTGFRILLGAFVALLLNKIVYNFQGFSKPPAMVGPVLYLPATSMVGVPLTWAPRSSDTERCIWAFTPKLLYALINASRSTP